MRTLHKILPLFVFVSLSFFDISKGAEPISKPPDELKVPEELKTPAQPAFTLLGVSPTSIDRPSTPKAFAVGLLGAFTDSHDSIPRNLALEVAPYWWSPRPLETYETLNARTGPFEATWQTFSLSLATSALDVTNSGVRLEGTSVGAGVRFSIIQGRLPKAALKAKDKLVAELSEIAGMVPESGAFDEGEAKQKAMRKAAEELAQYNLQRVGFQLDFAAAATVDFANDKTETSDFGRAGAWLTLGYRTDEPGDSPDDAGAVELSDFTFLGTIRYIRDERPTKAEDMVDSGIRILWRARKTPIGLSLEYLYRWKDGEDQDRLVGLLEYRVNENWSIIASYGKTFGSDFDGSEELVATLGVSIGLGKHGASVSAAQ